MQKSQASLEFLMTYGWVILFVIIIIGGMMIFIRPGSITAERCLFGTTTGIFCRQYTASSGAVQLEIENHLSGDITITGAVVTQGGNSCSMPVGGVNVNEGGSVVLNMSDGASCSALTQPGTVLDGDISITYINSGSFQKSITGSVITQIPE